ncbi:DUF6079 family protein [Mycobacterium sp. E2479]|uniref:DUF6079 family protein n=1 Tax=Mycobacterium sp. E2479 TaxID=1834134 RepID=UPI000801190D|nr:DUF6079 family protein [Mycobacterium sp. E2479]OBH54321.1 hypothetical protein A5686_08210 [Mycobacterium sp. E2479]
MKYADLLQPAEPLETVKQIRASGTLENAKRDVETFVISDRMADQLTNIIIPALRYDAGDSSKKGVFVVATYGTGKTHLMSTIAGVAEHKSLSDSLQRPDVAEAAKLIAGRFNVIRFDIGATTLPLREIVAIEIQRGLALLGVDFKFPDWSEVTNSKDAFTDMMAAFEAVHPDHGLLFVLDELLDYLRGRKDGELVYDLAFLREIGEIAASTRFRLIAGLQEAIFDNPRFAGVADTVRRVRDRFEQVRIAKEDVAFVVERRLLNKDATQRAKIADHLQTFAPLYDGMAEHMDDFVALFPVHPDYLRTFNDMRMIEKREVLRTVEAEVNRLRDSDIPTDRPGLICADSYRARLADDPSTRTIPEVQLVLEKSDVLRSKVASTMPDQQYVNTALRIIDGLTIHRLTTDDVNRPIGMTTEMLRDELCLLPPGLPERDSLFLKTTIDTVVHKILTAVSGQFLSIDPENGQIYLDVTKDIDYDQQIEQRAESLDEQELDRAYYLAMEQVLGVSDDPYVAGFRIWQYDLPWATTNADRRGYLFMGAPNERSTAQPPRDFYIYFIQPYDPPRFTDEEKPDEVFVRLAKPADEFTAALRTYAGATAKAKESTQAHRPVYEDKARRALQGMVVWLRTNMATAMTVTYRGETKSLGTWLATVPGERSKVQDQIDAVASTALNDHFGTRYPGYPHFSRRITPSTLEADVRVALTQIASRRPTSAGTAILQALELLADDGTELRSDGTYATELLAKLKAAAGKVLNRNDLLQPLDPGVPVWGPWHLEPAWLLVVAGALCQQGAIEISIDGQRIDALGLDRLTRYTPDQLAEFDHLAPPKKLPVTQLRAVVAILGIPAGAVKDSGADEKLAIEVVTGTNDILRRTDSALRAVIDGVELWGEPLFDLVNERARRLENLKDFLGNLKVRDTPGKLNSLNIDETIISQAAEGKAELTRVEDIIAAREKLSAVADYLREAHGVFGAGVEESRDALRLRSEMTELLQSADPIDPARVVALRTAGEELRRRFADLASRAYRHDHINASGDARKRKLLEGPVAVLNQLQSVSILAAGPFAQLQGDVAEIRSLFDIDEHALKKSVVLPDQKPPRPIDGRSADARLADCERRADGLVSSWTDTLVDSLNEPEMAEQIGYLSDPTAKAKVETLARTRTLPNPIDDAFLEALNQVFVRVDIRHITSAEITAALFPDTSPATADQLRNRLDTFIESLVPDVDAERVRFLPTGDDAS